MRLYVAGDAPNSVAARTNLRRLLASHDPSSHSLEIVDCLRDPMRALREGVLSGEAGRVTYTQWLNEGGTLEADLTVTKLDDDRFWVVASDTAHRHALTWMRRHFAANDAHAFVTDVTSGYAQINVQGPRSRELLASLTSQKPTMAPKKIAAALLSSRSRSSRKCGTAPSQ